MLELGPRQLGLYIDLLFTSYGSSSLLSCMRLAPNIELVLLFVVYVCVCVCWCMVCSEVITAAQQSQREKSLKGHLLFQLNTAPLCSSRDQPLFHFLFFSFTIIFIFTFVTLKVWL